MRLSILILALIALGATAATAQSDNDHIGLYLDSQATTCSAALDGPGQVVTVKVLAVLPDLAAPIIAAEFCLTNLPPSGGAGEGMWIADWGTALVIGDPRYALALAWTTPQPGPIVELGTITFYSLAAADWIGADHWITASPTITWDHPISVVDAGGNTIVVGGAGFVFNCSEPSTCFCWGESGPLCRVEPAALDFGEVIVGHAISRTLTVTNSGAGLLEGSVSLSGSSGFAIESGAGAFALGAGQRHSVRIGWEAGYVGLETAVLDLGTPNCPAIPCTGVGLQGYPECEMEYAFTDFGDVTVGDYGWLQITIHNTGDAPLSGVFPPGDGDFYVAYNYSHFNLPPGEHHLWNVFYLPTTPGPASWTLDLQTEYCQPLTLTANALESGAACEVVPQALDFGDVPVGTWSTKPFTVRNTGTDRFLLRLPLWCGDFFLPEGGENGWYNLLTLDPGEEMEFHVRFWPTELGPASCDIDLQALPCAHLQVGGTGTSGEACTLEPETLDFGAVALGFHTEQTVVIRNDGTQSFDIDVASGTDPFATVSGAGAHHLDPGEQAEVRVRFTPQALGLIGEELSLGDGPCPAVPLIGFGRESITGCTVVPDTLHFGEVPVGAFTERSLTVSNAGDLGFDFTVAALDGKFTTVSGAGEHHLDSGEAVEVRVRFTPETIGFVEAELSLGENPCHSVPLSGTGRVAIDSCTVSPPASDFGAVWVGTVSSSHGFTLRNMGDFQLLGAIALQDPHFTVTYGGGPFDLAPGESRFFMVRFTPQTRGLHVATVDFGNATCPQLELSGFGLWAAEPDNRIGLFADPEATICALDAPVGEPIGVRILALVPDFSADGITGAEFRIAGLDALAGFATASFTWSWPPVEGDPEGGIRFEFPAATGGLVELGQLHLDVLQAIPADLQLRVDWNSATHDLTVRDSAGEEWDVNGGLFTLNCESPVLCGCVSVNTPVVLSDFSITAEAGLAVLRWATGEILDAEFRLVGAAQGSEWEVAHRQESDGSYRAEDPRWAEQGGARVDYRLFGHLPGEDWQLLREESLASPAPAGRARLLAAYPNPFNPSVSIPIRLPAAQALRLIVHDLAGRRVATIAEGGFPAGERTLVWDGRDEAGRPVGSGVYFVRLEAAGVSESQKLVLLR